MAKKHNGHLKRDWREKNDFFPNNQKSNKLFSNLVPFNFGAFGYSLKKEERTFGVMPLCTFASLELILTQFSFAVNMLSDTSTQHVGIF